MVTHRTDGVPLLQAHLSDRLAAIRVDPEGSRLDHFLRIYLGDGPLHLIYQSPAGCGGGREDRQTDRHTQPSGFFCLLARNRYEHIPPHLMSCACLAAWLKLRRWNSTTHDANNRTPSLILHLQIWPHHRVTHQPAKQWSEPPSHRELHKSSNYHKVTCVQKQNTHFSTFHSTHKLLVAFLQSTFTLFYAVPSHSVKYGDVATQLVDRMEWIFVQRPLVAGGQSTSAQVQKGATFSWQSVITLCCGTK